MRALGWMLSLLGTIAGAFTAWAERMPELKIPLLLPHGHIPGIDITGSACLLALGGVVLMWRGRPRWGGVLVLAATGMGLFGADQLWTTAGCILFLGGMVELSSTLDPSVKRST